MILKYKQVVIPINRLVSWNLTPKQFRNVKPYQVGTGTEKTYQFSTNLVLELKNRSKYRLMLVLERKNSSSISTNRTDRSGRYEPPCSEHCSDH